MYADHSDMVQLARGCTQSALFFNTTMLVPEQILSYEHCFTGSLHFLLYLYMHCSCLMALDDHIRRDKSRYVRLITGLQLHSRRC